MIKDIMQKGGEQMCKHWLVSAAATYFSVYFLITAITQPVNIWWHSAFITVLVFVATASCPVLNHGKWNCCELPTGKKKRKRK